MAKFLVLWEVDTTKISDKQVEMQKNLTLMLNMAKKNLEPVWKLDIPWRIDCSSVSEQNKRTSYQTDLSDKEWQKVETCIPKQKTNWGRKRKHPLFSYLASWRNLGTYECSFEDWTASCRWQRTKAKCGGIGQSIG